MSLHITEDEDPNNELLYSAVSASKRRPTIVQWAYNTSLALDGSLYATYMQHIAIEHDMASLSILFSFSLVVGFVIFLPIIYG